MKRLLTLLILASLGLMGCFQVDRQIPGQVGSTKGLGVITGRVITVENTGLADVQVTVNFQGNLYQTSTQSNGTFVLEIPGVSRRDGVQLSFYRPLFERRAKAAVFELPNLRIDIGEVVLPILGADPEDIYQPKVITGQVLDDFTYDPLPNANVVVYDTLNNAIVATTDVAGRFTLASNFFADDSTYIVSIYKNYYTPRSDIIAAVAGAVSTILNSPTRLYRKFGFIQGCVLDGNTGNQCLAGSGALAGATVTIVDSNYDLITKTTDANGNFFTTAADTVFFHTGKEYDVTISYPNYFTKVTKVKITSTGSNTMIGSPLRLMPDVRITGRLQESTSCTPPGIPQAGHGNYVNGALVEVSTNPTFTHIILTQNTANQGCGGSPPQDGTFCFSSDKIKLNDTYHLRISKPFYATQTFSYMVTAAGDNVVPSNPRQFCTLPAPTYFLSGQVRNFYSNQPVNGVLVILRRGTFVTSDTTSAKAQVGTFSFADIPWGGGVFRVGIPGAAPTNGENFTIELSRSGFTGRDEIAKHAFTFTYNSSLEKSHAGNIYVSVNKDYGEDASCAPDCSERDLNQMHPLGIHFDAGGLKEFSADIKQSYEPFLTGKIGLTITARERSLIDNRQHANMAIRKQDASAIYLHLDDLNYTNYPNVLPADALIAHTIPVNGPDTLGYVMNGIGGDTRAIPYNVKNYTLYQFYVATASSGGPANNFVIETTGTTDTHITLYNYNRVELASDDNSGSGGINGRISRPLLKGWYFVLVRGANNNVFGYYNVRVTGPVQIGPVIPGVPMSSYLTAAQGALISYYNRAAISGGGGGPGYNGAEGNNDQAKIYVAGAGEAGSSAFIRIVKYEQPGGLLRGFFYGTLRDIAPGPISTINISTPSNPGYFNFIRQE